MDKSMSRRSIASDLSSHNLNNSSSKQKFSFPKASRFEQSRFGCDSFYQIPTTKSGRTTSFGYGSKDMGIRLNRNFPQPASYNIQSQFLHQRKKGFSFGTGRQEMTVGGPLNTVVYSKEIPGPGTYKNYSTLQTRASAIRSRLPDKSLDYLKKLPGPGSYAYESLANNQYYISSRYTNQTNSAKMTQKSSRLAPLSKTIDLGPGQYNVNQSDIKKDGKYVLSKDKGSQSKVFARSPRQSIVYKHLLSTPGPGSYSPFTYFGPA